MPINFFKNCRGIHQGCIGGIGPWRTVKVSSVDKEASGQTGWPAWERASRTDMIPIRSLVIPWLDQADKALQQSWLVEGYKVSPSPWCSFAHANIKYKAQKQDRHGPPQQAPFKETSPQSHTHGMSKHPQLDVAVPSLPKIQWHGAARPPLQVVPVCSHHTHQGGRLPRSGFGLSHQPPPSNVQTHTLP